MGGVKVSKEIESVVDDIDFSTKEMSFKYNNENQIDQLVFIEEVVINKENKTEYKRVVNIDDENRNILNLLLINLSML